MRFPPQLSQDDSEYRQIVDAAALSDSGFFTTEE
jgi:hypothetical protein